MFFRYQLFLLNQYSFFRNWPYVRLNNGCFKISIIRTGKTVIVLILYTLLKNLARVCFLRGIPRTDTIILRLDLNESSIFQNADLQSVENSTVIFVQVCDGNSTIVLPNYFDSDVCYIIISFRNFDIDSTSFISFILLIVSLFLFKITSPLHISFMYS